VAAKGLQERQLAFLSPAGHGLGRHVQDVSHLRGPQVAGKLRSSLAPGLGCHSASLSCGGPMVISGPIWGERSSGGTAGTCGGHAAGCHAGERRMNRMIMESGLTACHSPIGLFQHLHYLARATAPTGQPWQAPPGCTVSQRPRDALVHGYDAVHVNCQPRSIPDHHARKRSGRSSFGENEQPNPAGTGPPSPSAPEGS
jgi:hypothetical protein